MHSQVTIVVVLGLIAISAAQQCGKVAKEPTKLNSQGLIDGNGVTHNKHQGIINGDQAQQGAIPWQAKLFVSRSKFPFCSGTLLNENWVVTAANCVDYHAAATIGVQLGGHQRLVMSGGNSITCKVSKVVKHPKFGQGAFVANDIALVRLTGCNKPVSSSKTIKAICLPSPSADFRNPNAFGLISGWGKTERGHASALHQAVVRLESYNVCKGVFTSSFTTGNMCASGQKNGKIIDTCQGDSGSPLAVRTSKGIWQLAGIDSFGMNGCAGKGEPFALTHVPMYVNWMKSIIRT